ncbi:MAG: hypothetical protein JRN45_00520 [Nitrososphaerota archaeon]|nr:hypothetical protein [Nitrososphaerota archaeon]
MTDEEQAKMEHDWLIAEFQIVAGAILAFALGVAIAALAGQLTLFAAAFLIAVSGVWLAYIWRYFQRRTTELRQTLNSAKGLEEVV